MNHHQVRLRRTAAEGPSPREDRLVTPWCDAQEIDDRDLVLECLEQAEMDAFIKRDLVIGANGLQPR